MKSQKEHSLDRKILERLSGRALEAAELSMRDEEIHAMQEYANAVSIKRLGYNDHGPVHMRTVCYNAIKMLDLLAQAGIKTNLEIEELGDREDSTVAVIMAASLHDVGMSVGRQDHELHSVILARPILDRLLSQLYPASIDRRVIVRSMAIEGIIGHMASRRVHSLEAGIVMVADGCDMQKGRARIPLILNTEAKMGDIHKYSANSISMVKIGAGAEKPIRIQVSMSSEVGFFQVEEVLLTKIDASPAKPHIELCAAVVDEEGQPISEEKRYL